MRIKSRTGWIFLILYLAACASKSQSQFQGGLLPAINISTEVNQNIGLNVKIEQRHVVIEEQQYIWSHELLDWSTLVTRNVGLVSKVAVGGLLRWRGNKVIQRMIQQITVVPATSLVKIGHRFRADQTFAKDDITTWRLRYRVTAQLPLSGQDVNNREWYFKFANEYLLIFEGNTNEIETRIGAFAGYRLGNDNKVEMGLDNRTGRLFTKGKKIQNWIGVTWYRAL